MTDNNDCGVLGTPGIAAAIDPWLSQMLLLPEPICVGDVVAVRVSEYPDPTTPDSPLRFWVALRHSDFTVYTRGFPTKDAALTKAFELVRFAVHFAEACDLRVSL